MVKKNDLQVITGCNSFAAFTKVKQVDSFILAICNNVSFSVSFIFYY